MDGNATNRNDSSAFNRAMPALFVLLWATGFIGAKFGLPYAPPLMFLSWRFILVIALMTLIALAMRAPWPRGVQILHVAVAGVLLQAGYLGGVFAGIDLGMSAGLSSLIVSLQPILTAFAGPFFGEPVSRRQWAGFVLGFGGVFMVVFHKINLGMVGWESLSVTLLALLSITAGTLYQKRFVRPCDVRTANAVQLAAAFAVSAPLAVMLEHGALQWHPDLVVAMAWSVLALTLGGSSLLYLLIQRGAATRVTSLMYLVPPCTAVLAWMLFREPLGATVIGGMSLTALGVWLVVR